MAEMTRKGDDSDVCMYELFVVNVKTSKHEKVKLKLHCGPGDTPEPVITIMLPGED